MCRLSWNLGASTTVSSKVYEFSLKLKKYWSGFFFFFQNWSCVKQRGWLFVSPLLQRLQLINCTVNAVNRGLWVVSWCGEVDENNRISFCEASFQLLHSINLFLVLLTGYWWKLRRAFWRLCILIQKLTQPLHVHHRFPRSLKVAVINALLCMLFYENQTCTAVSETRRWGFGK